MRLRKPEIIDFGFFVAVLRAAWLAPRMLSWAFFNAQGWCAIKQEKGFQWGKGKAISSIALIPFAFALAIFLWYEIIRIADYPVFILPPPDLVWLRFLRAINDGILLRHSLVTLSEVLGGLALGLLFATVLGYVLAKSRKLERFMAPYLVASQSIPVVAVAPLLVIWFGPGLTSKVLICALIVFFPVLINTVVGLRSVPKDLRDLMRSLNASPWQTFRLLEVPAAMSVFLGGLRIGATLSVIGAVVGEFVGADRGLGFLINVGRGAYDIALVFVAVITLVVMALFLYAIVMLLERRLLFWQNEDPGIFPNPKEQMLEI